MYSKILPKERNRQQTEERDQQLEMSPERYEVHKEGQQTHTHSPEVFDDDTSESPILGRKQFTGQSKSSHSVGLQYYNYFF